MLLVQYYLLYEVDEMTDRKKYFINDDYTANLAKLAAAATSNEELAKLCQRMYLADYINLEGMDLWLAKHALTAVFRVLRQYPALRRRIHYFGTLRGFAQRKDDLFAFLYPQSTGNDRRQVKEMTDQTVKGAQKSFEGLTLAIAFCTTYGDMVFSGILLNEHQFDEQEVVYDLLYDVAIGHSPIGCSTVRAIVDHELGHLLDFWLDISDYSAFLETIRPLGAEYVGKNLSRYCANNGQIHYAEVLAEGFAEYRHNPNPRPIAKFVGRMVDQEYQKMLKRL